MRRSGGGHWVVTAAVALALTAGAAGCGSDEPSGGSSSGTSASNAATPATSPASSATTVDTSKQVTDYAAYVGGKGGAADAGMSPITIGFINQQGGPTDVGPNATVGAELAIDYVNQQLGGIDGHPLRLVTCFTSTSESQGQTCAQKMLNDKSVVAVAMGAEALGDVTFQRTMNGAKPIIYGISGSPVDAVSKNSYVFYGEQTSVVRPWGTYARDVLHAKTGTVVYPEVPGLTEGATAMTNALEQANIEVKKVGVSPTASDLVGPLTAAGVQTADVIVPLTDPKTCVNLAKTLEQLGVTAPTVSTPFCLDPAVAKGLGGDLPQWDFGTAVSLIGDPTDASSVQYVKLLKAAGHADLMTDTWPQVAFGEVLTLAKMMNEIGADKVSPETIAEQIQAFKGPLLMGPPTVDCGADAKLPGACTDAVQFFHYEGKGKFVRASGWLGPPTKG